MRLVWFRVGLLLLVLAGCAPKPGELGPVWGEDVTGASYGRNFTLTGLDGRTHTLADYHGKVLVLFFGYTHCPEVCPTTLYDLSQSIKRLGSHADKVQVLFITVDPTRDTPAVLSSYVRAFDPAFGALYGNARQTASTLAAFGAVARRHPADAAGNYEVDHSAFVYVYDRQGNLRLRLPFGQSADKMAHDIGLLLR